MAAFEDEAIESFVRERALELAEECRARDPRAMADDLGREFLALLGWLDSGDPMAKLAASGALSMPVCRLARRCDALVRAIDNSATFRRR